MTTADARKEDPKTAELNIPYFYAWNCTWIWPTTHSSVKCPIVNTDYAILHVIHIYIHTCIHARLIPY